MKKEWYIFQTAVMFLTRISVSSSLPHDNAYMQKSLRYFPVVGWLVGGFSALVYLVFSKYISSDIGILASMIASVLATGAMHEDGLADVCDGFGGGWTKEKILLIMKDSRIGAFGSMGLIAVLASKFMLLRELPQFTPDLVHPSSNILLNSRYMILTLVAAHGLSRLMPVLVIRYLDNVSDPQSSKSKPMSTRRLSAPELLLTIAFALVPFIFMSWHFLLAIAPALYITYASAKYFRKWIGGYTGDCLGAIQQLSEISFYLGVIIVWRYVL